MTILSKGVHRFSYENGFCIYVEGELFFEIMGSFKEGK